MPNVKIKLSFWFFENLPQQLLPESVAETETDGKAAEVIPVCKTVVKVQVSVADTEIEEYSLVRVDFRTDQSVCRRGDLKRSVSCLHRKRTPGGHTAKTHTDNGTGTGADIWIESFEHII